MTRQNLSTRNLLRRRGLVAGLVSLFVLTGLSSLGARAEQGADAPKLANPCFIDNATLSPVLALRPHNFDFEGWVDNQLLIWNVPPGHESYVSREQDTAHEGRSSLRFRGGYASTTLSQVIPVAPEPGDLISMRAAVRTSEAQTTYLALRTMNGELAVSQTHPGDGRWHVLEAKYLCPPGFRDTTIETIIHHSNRPKQAAFIDDVFVSRPFPEMLLNAGFEHWVSGVPLGWAVRVGQERYVTSATDPEGNGLHVLKTEGPYTYQHVSQECVMVEPLAGKTVRIGARVKCFEPKSAFISLHLPDFYEFHSTRHPGDGQWHVLKTHARVPPYYPGNTFMVILQHGGQPEQPALFDSVSVTVE